MGGPHSNLKESWAIVNKLPLFFRESRGHAVAGTPRVLHLHGFAISGTYLLPTANLLAASYQTYVPDLPGFGRSIEPAEPDYGAPMLAEGVLAFMDSLGIERTTLVGNSTGCIAAIECARRFPHRLERLILVSPAGGPFNRPLVRGLWQLGVDALREPLRLIPIALGDYVRFGVLDGVRLYRSIAGYPVAERLKLVHIPTLIVFGDRDPLVSQDQLRAMARDVRQTTVVRIEGAAHAINFSHPEELAGVIHRYLTGQKLADDPNARGIALPFGGQTGSNRHE